MNKTYLSLIIAFVAFVSFFMGRFTAPVIEESKQLQDALIKCNEYGQQKVRDIQQNDFIQFQKQDSIIQALRGKVNDRN